MAEIQQGALLRRMAVLCAGISLSVLLAGCTFLEAPVDGDSVASAPSQEPKEPQLSSECVEPLSDDHPWDGFDANPTCPGTPGLVPVSSEREDRVSGYLVPVIKDQGSMPHATGEARVNDAGERVAYLVAEGDTAWAIADRFCIG